MSELATVQGLCTWVPVGRGYLPGSTAGFWAGNIRQVEAGLGFMARDSDSVNSTALGNLNTYMNASYSGRLWRRQRHPTPVLLPGESQGRGRLVGCRLWGRTESDMTEAT